MEIEFEPGLDRARVIATIREHTPSITDEIEEELNNLIVECAFNAQPYGGVDSADCAIRICRCGERIEDYYGYVDHLAKVFGEKEVNRG